MKVSCVCQGGQLWPSGHELGRVWFKVLVLEMEKRSEAG